MTAPDVRTMTTAQVSAATGIKQNTLRQWRARGLRPHSFRAHGVVLYRATEVEAWLAEAEAATETAARPSAPAGPGGRDEQRTAHRKSA